MTAVFEVKRENNAALSKISPDFAEFVRYGFRKFHYSFKAPDKVRIESNATLFGLLRGISVRDGDHKNFYIPALHIHKTADVTGQANKKETALDFGVMVGDLWNDYYVWYMRTETTPAGSVYVLGLKPSAEKHGGNMFSNYVHPLPHVWIPTTIKLYNAEGQFGGELDYSTVVVNSGLPDKIFN
jgi:outer membrane lipoprotein-sorting protein